MSLALVWALCLIASAMLIRLSMDLAIKFGLTDRPGGHKQHVLNTPFVGGVGIFGTLLCTLAYIAMQDSGFSASQLVAMTLGSAIIFAIGLVDDLRNLNFKIRFMAQAVVASLMGLWGDVILLDLGELLPGTPLALGLLALPFTIFATVGVINALNMIDGIDGLSGSVSLVSLSLIAVVAYLAGDSGNTMLAVALMGALGGFLYYNLRYPTNKHARVFLGDNGSMLLGFLFAWLFIDLSQGESPAMTPVTALWLFAIPLMDTVGVMLRRIWLGKSPFRADRHHLHHLFMRASYRVSDTVYIIATIQLLLGGIGLAGLYLGVPQYIMLVLFMATFALYFLIIARPWRCVPFLRTFHQQLGFTSLHAQGLFIGYVNQDKYPALTRLLVSELGQRFDYRISLHESATRRPGQGNIYAVVEMLVSDWDDTLDGLQQLVSRIRKGLKNHPDIQVRQFINRDSNHDRRVGHKNVARQRRWDDRRAAEREKVLQVLEYNANPMEPTWQIPSFDLDAEPTGSRVHVTGHMGRA